MQPAKMRSLINFVLGIAFITAGIAKSNVILNVCGCGLLGLSFLWALHKNPKGVKNND